MTTTDISEEGRSRQTLEEILYELNLLDTSTLIEWQQILIRKGRGLGHPLHGYIAAILGRRDREAEEKQIRDFEAEASAVDPASLVPHPQNRWQLLPNELVAGF